MSIGTDRLKLESKASLAEADARFAEWLGSLGYCDGGHRVIDGPRYLGFKSCRACGKIVRPEGRR